MQEKYFVTSQLPICSYFDIDGERHCDVCKNSPYCGGDVLSIIFDERAAAELWQQRYRDRSIYCRLLDYSAAVRSGQKFLYYDAAADLLRSYIGRAGQLSEVSSTAPAEYKVAGKTARFAANIVKLVKQGK